MYRNHYNPEDRRNCRICPADLQAPWVVTYDNYPEIRQFYQGCHEMQFALYYSTAATRPLATEVMFYGNLRIPSPPALTRRNI